MSEHRSVPELDAEREIDLRSVWRRIAARWWLPVGGLIAGALLGVLVSLGGGSVYQADTLLYLGQPFAPSGGGQIQSLSTNPITVDEIVRSERAIRTAAAASGLTPDELRGKISTQAIVTPGLSTRALSPLVKIGVQGPSASQAERASASLADTVVKSLSPYVQRKIELLKRQIATEIALLAQASSRIADALRQRRQSQANKSLSLADRLLVQASVNSTLQFYEARSANLRGDLTSAEQVLSLAEKVERSQIVQPPVGVSTTATSRRNSAVIGGVVGLLLGILAAYLADPFLQRRRGPAPAA